MSSFDLPDRDGVRCDGRQVARCVLDARPRRTLVTTGTVRSIRTYVTPHGGRDHVCELDDGTATVHLRFLGRRDVPGMVPGARVSIEGTVRTEGHRLVVWNPFYRLEEAPGDG